MDEEKPSNLQVQVRVLCHFQYRLPPTHSVNGRVIHNTTMADHAAEKHGKAEARADEKRDIAQHKLDDQASATKHRAEEKASVRAKKKQTTKNNHKKIHAHQYSIKNPGRSAQD